MLTTKARRFNYNPGKPWVPLVTEIPAADIILTIRKLNIRKLLTEDLQELQQRGWLNDREDQPEVTDISILTSSEATPQEWDLMIRRGNEVLIFEDATPEGWTCALPSG